ncbi:DUF3107 domain-containing protein [Actinomadura madurae]|uniref:DUF3107 domain-containing protein n=1 Tax=Actinomadura madurae TaxID=1993 RepID=UPI0020D20FC6|nr:DUF3107 domain-containing protein [Actinomadura madurae]MCP9970720.1 DUF3107 domain-containing protein [Actinomadura madurae]
MQVRIGVQNVPKELVVDTALSADEVQDALREALSGPDGVLVLKDRRAGRIVIPRRAGRLPGDLRRRAAQRGFRHPVHLTR